jgi:hypothetical protein
MSSNNETGCVKIIGLIAGIATIIGVIIAVLNWLMPFNPIGVSPFASDSAKSQVNTKVPQSATDFLPTPTNTLLPSSSTSKPSPTLILDTPPDSILNVGQSWRENNFELNLVYANYNYICQNFDAPEIVLEIKFELTNLGLYDLPIRYSLSSVSAQSNLGEMLPVGHYGTTTYGGCGYTDWVNNFESIDTIIQSHQTIELITDNDRQRDTLLIRANFPNPSLTEIIISISNIAGITNAHWRVPIVH